MKKFFAVAAALLIAVASFAQETNRDENGKIKYGSYETNKLKDNVFVGFGLGANSIWNWSNQGHVPYVTAPGLALEGYVGKWFTPGLGTRLGIYGLSQGAWNKAADESWKPFENGQHTVAVDLLWNFSNSVFGYSETRKWNWVPYLRAGLDLYGDGALYKNLNKEWVLGFGSMITYKMNEKWNFVIDNPIAIAKTTESTSMGLYTKADDSTGEKIKEVLSRFSFPYAVMVGFSYNVGKTNWTRTATTAAAAAAAIAAAEAAANAKAAAAEKAAQEKADKAAAEAKQLADEAVKAAEAKGNIDGLFDEPVVVYFEIGKSKLTSAEKAHAEYAIKNIIARGENVKFTLGGSADTKTGSAKRNKQLSEERAKCVYNLIDELGVSRDNITVVEWDGKTQRFDTVELNRAVIIDKQ